MSKKKRRQWKAWMLMHGRRVCWISTGRAFKPSTPMYKKGFRVVPVILTIDE